MKTPNRCEAGGTATIDEVPHLLYQHTRRVRAPHIVSDADEIPALLYLLHATNVLRRTVTSGNRPSIIPIRKGP
jgi:hypothetical protein